VQVRLQRMYPGSRYTATARAVTIPLPTDKTDAELIEWAGQVLTTIFGAA
jgi:transcription-repair coupling factor (superfamily II helicase)